MDAKPHAIISFEQEKMSSFEGMTFFQDPPVERLKLHIAQTGGKLLKSEISADGTAFVIWEERGRQYRAWSFWPDNDTIHWKAFP